LKKTAGILKKKKKKKKKKPKERNRKEENWYKKIKKITPVVCGDVMLEGLHVKVGQWCYTHVLKVSLSIEFHHSA